jgi:hypothetical protein
MCQRETSRKTRAEYEVPSIDEVSVTHAVLLIDRMRLAAPREARISG